MRVDVDPRHGERRDGLDQAWWPLLAEVLPGWTAMPLPNLGPGLVDLAAELDLRGVILSGGNDLGTCPERDASEVALLEWARPKRVPVLGVCRGLQLMVAHAGGSLEAHPGHVAVEHTLEPGPGEAPWGEIPALVNSYHNLGIRGHHLPAGLSAWALDEQGWVEALTGAFGTAIMWHPERPSPSADFDRRLLRHCFAELG